MSISQNNKNIFIAMIIFCVQFANALEYMMVNPIFPFMAVDLHVAVSNAGYVASIYTGSSVIAGLLSFFFIDRFDKHSVLWLCLLFIGALTLVVPLLHSLTQVLWIRFVTGLFGGISLGVAMAVLLDSTAYSSLNDHSFQQIVDTCASICDHFIESIILSYIIVILICYLLSCCMYQ